MASLTSPSLPNSFQLRLGFQCRKSSLVFMRTRVRTVKRRICSFAASESAGKGRDGSERSLSGDSWTNSGSSSDSFSGWFGADSGGSQRKRGFGGIVGVGVAGVILAAGLTIATLSLSKRSASGTKQEMEPLTVQQEVLLASDNQNDLVEEVRNEDNIVMPDEGNLSESSPESKTGTDKESFSSPEFTEFNSESRPDDDINVRTSLIENVESASNNIDAIKNASSQEDMQFRSGFDGHTVPSKSNPSSPRMAEYVIVEGSSDASSFKESEGNPAIAPPGLVTELKENRIAVNPIDSSVSDADLANLNAYYHEEISVSREIEDSKLLLDSSGSGHQIPSETALNSSVSIELDVILDPHVESKDKMETVTSPLNTDFDLSKMLQVPNEGITSHLEGNNLDETGSSGTTSLSVLANPYANDPNTNGYSEMDRSKSLFEPPIPEGSFSSAGIPAPSLVSVALQVPPGKVLVPAAVDQVQGQALAALQVLKVIEADVQPGDLCTRREYARWLVFASNALSRNTVSKVYPAMYIENVTDLAFDDITPEDRDFASIQGLAEAGLISSKLSRRDMLSSPDEEQKIFLFSPNSPVSRQDLVSWKMALDKRQLPEVDSKILYQRSGFIDIDKINPDAFPALVADLSAGEQGIVALAFGYTRLFQPDKPVTKAQAAIAIATGEAADIVSEELTRIEAESMAEAAVAAHSALVAQVEKDVNASFEKELAMEREKIDAVEKLAEEARLELERLRAEREEENNALLRGKAAVESEMEVLSRLRREVEEQLQSLMSNKMEISFERERINKLRKEAESENQAIARLQYELEVERKALSMARAWAEDEAKRAREHAKALEEARERWERHGIKVIVDDDLRDDASAEVTWLEAGKQSAVSGTVSRAENLVENLKAMASKIRGDSKAVVEKIIQKIISLISTLREWATEAARQAGELQGAAVLKVSESVQELHQNTAEFSFAVKEGAKRIAGDCKEGVEKFTQKFKT